MSRSPIKKHDRDHDVQARVRAHKNYNWQDWTTCEMHGHDFDDNAICRDCGWDVREAEKILDEDEPC